MKRIILNIIALALIITSSLPSLKGAKQPLCTESDCSCAPALYDGGEKCSYGAPYREDAVEVLYLYEGNRCASSHTIERLTAEAVDENFAAERRHGRVQMLTIDMTTPEGMLLAERYSISSHALLLNRWAQGNEQLSDITALALSYHKEPSTFKAVLSSAIRDMLDGREELRAA